jgi:hypothetical protein
MFRSQFARTHLFQIVFSKGNISKDNYPMSRGFLYGDDMDGDQLAKHDPAEHAGGAGSKDPSSRQPERV